VLNNYRDKEKHNKKEVINHQKNYLKKLQKKPQRKLPKKQLLPKEKQNKKLVKELVKEVNNRKVDNKNKINVFKVKMLEINF